MTVHDWRGHVRFFTENDLRTMVESIGFRTVETGYEEVFYNVFHDAYFEETHPVIQNWRKHMLKDNRQFANDVHIMAEKPKASHLQCLHAL